MSDDKYYILRVDHIELKTFKIQNLFNLYNYEINFDEPIQYMYGINGIGKTTIFNIFNAIFHGNFDELTKIPFQDIELEFDTIFNAEYKRIRLNLIKQETGIKYKFLCNEQVKSGLIKQNMSEFGTHGYFGQSFCFIDDSIFKQDDEKFEDFMDYIRDTSSESIIAYFNFTNIFDNDTGDLDLSFILFFDIILCFYDMKVISTERLNINSKQLQEYQDEIDFNFKKKSTESRNEFMHTPVNMPEKLSNIPESLSLENIKKRILTTGLQQRIKSLEVINLNYEDKPGIQKQITFFISIINDYFINKQVVLQQNKLHIESTNMENIPIEGLSSGEKQIFILFFDCVFCQDWEYFIFIDEPEISLHVSWQLKFSHTIRKINENNPRIKFLIASHSPQIIKNQLSLCIKADQI
jgi:predicted ATPase